MSNKIEKQTYSIKKTIFFLFIIFSFFILIFYAGYTVHRTKSFYSYVKSSQRASYGKVIIFDHELGFAPIPNSTGWLIFPIGPEIPVRFDEHGFRVPADGKSVSQKKSPVTLTLGGSFTYGDANYAEDTYPYLIGQSLGGHTLNKGVGSYGLSQMLILAKRLVPSHKPDYLIVQYSPWLTSRAQRPFAPTYFRKIPTPYFYGENQELLLHPPVFAGNIGNPLTHRYRQSPRTAGDFISFFSFVGLPLFVHDDFNMALYYTKRYLRLIPAPNMDRERIERHAYGEIAGIAMKNGATMILVVLGDNHNPLSVPLHILPVLPESAIVVNAHRALLERLPEKTIEEYNNRYAIWRGDPPQMVDRHPNPYAHKIIAEEVVRSIKDVSGAQRDH
jgi:hypothetical protein